MRFDLTIRDLKKQQLKDLLDRIDDSVISVEQQLSSDSEQNPEGDDSAPSPSPDDLATPKQKTLMDKHKIKYDSGTTKASASDLISSFFDSKKQKKAGG